MNPRNARAQAGFTLQEMIVVMIVGSLLVGFGYTLYLYATGFYSRNVKAREHREAVSRLASLLVNDIERSRYALATDSTLLLERSDGSVAAYRVQRGKLIRSGVMISSYDSLDWSLQAKSESSAHGETSVDFRLGAMWKRDSCIVETSASVPWSSYGAFLAGKKKGAL